MMIEMCKHYTTTGYPYFKPRCKKGRFASLRCHSKNISCPYYEGEVIKEGETVRDEYKGILWD